LYKDASGLLLNQSALKFALYLWNEIYSRSKMAIRLEWTALILTFLQKSGLKFKPLRKHLLLSHYLSIF